MTLQLKSGFDSRSGFNFVQVLFNRLVCSFYCEDPVHLHVLCFVNIFPRFTLTPTIGAMGMMGYMRA